MPTLSFRERTSKVWRVGDQIYKAQPKYLMDNEVWCMSKMMQYGCIPQYERMGLELMCMKYIEVGPITDIKSFIHSALTFVQNLKREGIRHGDLTMPHVLPLNNRVFVIDWAESRVWADQRPDKREEGDMYWMEKTIEGLLKS